MKVTHDGRHSIRNIEKQHQCVPWDLKIDISYKNMIACFLQNNLYSLYHQLFRHIIYWGWHESSSVFGCTKLQVIWRMNSCLFSRFVSRIWLLCLSQRTGYEIQIHATFVAPPDLQTMIPADPLIFFWARTKCSKRTIQGIPFTITV